MIIRQELKVCSFLLNHVTQHSSNSFFYRNEFAKGIQFSKAIHPNWWNIYSSTKYVCVYIRVNEFQFINVIYWLKWLVEEFIWPQAFTHLSHNSITHREEKEIQHENWKWEEAKKKTFNWSSYTIITHKQCLCGRLTSNGCYKRTLL